jgi:hypothetical protein
MLQVLMASKVDKTQVILGTKALVEEEVLLIQVMAAQALTAALVKQAQQVKAQVMAAMAVIQTVVTPEAEAAAVAASVTEAVAVAALKVECTHKLAAVVVAVATLTETCLFI